MAENNPAISVVIPCLNEKDRILPLLDALANQDVRNFEVILADGGSDDGTRDFLHDYAEKHPDFPLRVIDNPQKSTAAGLNRAIRDACGEIIIRLDGHSRPADDYVRRCYDILRKSGADVVGGVWRISPGSHEFIAEAIAVGVGSILGAGASLYRVGAKLPAQDADTVPFGCFRKTTWEELRGYNESLLSNEDYEFNFRIRRCGGRVHFDPTISCEYFARPTLRALARQYWRYGWWKAQMLKIYPTSLKLRQAIPPVWILASVCLPVLGRVWTGPAMLAAALWLCYLTTVCYFSARLAKTHGQRIFLPLVAVFPTIHFAWGLAFWFGLVGIPVCMTNPKHRKLCPGT